MSRPRRRRPVRSVLLLLSGTLAVACADAPSAPFAPPTVQAARGTKATTAGPVVAAVEPAHGKQGETGKVVTITGSGFASGATVAWERDGVADPGVAVRSVVVLSSTQIEATIDIAPDAELDLYDVSVTTLDKKKGIGAEKFEVTLAIVLAQLDNANDASFVRGVNDRGEAVGYSGSMTPAAWSAAGSVWGLGGYGQAWEIDEAGTTIVGAADGYAVIWRRAGDGWAAAERLPLGSGAVGGVAYAVASDALSGAATILAGLESVKGPKGNATYSRPMLWRRAGDAWQRAPLPMPMAGAEVTAHVNDVNEAGEAAGIVDSRELGRRAVHWAADGTPTILGPADTRAQGIDGSGTIVVGTSIDGAVYWRRIAPGAWQGPIPLPGGCSRAMAVDDTQRIVGAGCSLDQVNGSAVVWIPDAGGYTALRLGGLGFGDEGGGGEAISRGGRTIGGGARSVSNVYAAIWRIF